MRFAVYVLPVALAIAVPAAAHAQAAQAVGLATTALSLAFGIMFPAPQCGPHDAAPRPQPYRPAPDYVPPPDRHADLEQHNNFDDDGFDEDFDQPVHHHPRKRPDSSYSRQPQTRPDAYDNSGQYTGVRPPDADQAGDQQSAEDYDQPQPASPPVSRRTHRRGRSQAQTAQQTQSGGQVAVIPSLPHGTQASPQTGFTPGQ